MEHRRLGRSGLKVSEISYGNWITHGSQVEEDAAVACVRAALEAGITTFDTADVYAGTRAESVLGRALAGVQRSSIEICTKVYWPTGDGVNERGLSRKHIIESCDASLKRLQTDHVDLYQAHRYDADTPLEETLRAFEDLVRAGKVLYVGVSEWRAAQIQDALRIAGELGFDPIVSSQPQYSMLWRVIDSEVVPVCRDGGVSQIVWSPIAQGVLTGKYAPGSEPPAGSRATDATGSRFVQQLLRPPVLEAVQRLQPIAADAGLSLAQLAVAWVLQNDNVASAIVGASRPEQVTENAKASGVRLSTDVMTAIDGALGDVVTRDPRSPAEPLHLLRRLEAHRVAGAPVLDQRHGLHAGVEQLPPHLTDPGFGVGLAAEARRCRGVGAGLGVVAPGPAHGALLSSAMSAGRRGTASAE